MSINRFSPPPKTAYQILVEDNPGIGAINAVGLRCAVYLESFDVETLALMEKVGAVLWRVVDAIYSNERNNLDVGGRLSLIYLRSSILKLWLQIIRQPVPIQPKVVISLAPGGAEILDQLQADMAIGTADTTQRWAHRAGTLCNSLIERGL